ncbi:MAG: helix-turn-helix transcriptional regulator [Myxococcales bacterium]|nr:helix-turn-helix transcriptional regulator [Myxococcales bacterium]
MARRERRRERSREEIVEAARRVLLRDGIAATTLDAVAKEVGLTKAALYYYYPSKDALLFEIIFGVLEAQSRGPRRGPRGQERRRCPARHRPRDGAHLCLAHGRLPPRVPSRSGRETGLREPRRRTVRAAPPAQRPHLRRRREEALRRLEARAWPGERRAPSHGLPRQHRGHRRPHAEGDRRERR